MSSRSCWLAGVAILFATSLGRAQTQSAPAWVELIDQGQNDSRLTGVQTLKGIKLEVVEDDGFWNAVRAVKLENWTYLVSEGRVIRRRPRTEALSKQLAAAAVETKQPPIGDSADGKWLEQILVHGSSKDSPLNVSELTFGPDGWLYLTAANGDQRVESWDGSRIDVLRTGVVFRMRPDGSRLQEFARGLLQPHGLAFDELGNAFCLDRTAADSKTDGMRLIHVLAGGDYGWLHDKKRSANDAQAITRPDRVRASLSGERAGTLPPMMMRAGSTASSALVYQGTAFPKLFRGALIVADPGGHAVRLMTLERDGVTFKVVMDFPLMISEDPAFSPSQVMQSPDGAIYVSSTTAASGGPIYRLTWSGVAHLTAIAPGPRDAWEKLTAAAEDQLWQDAESPDALLRQRAATRLLTANAARERFKEIMLDSSRATEIRATALLASLQIADQSVREALQQLLSDENQDIVRLAADGLGDATPTDKEQLAAATDAVEAVLGRTTDPAVERSLRLTLGKLAAAGGGIDVAEWGFESMSVTHRPKTPRAVFDAHVRALEMVPDAAKELMLGNLDVSVNFIGGDADELQRLRYFVTLTAEAMRTRQLATFLDALFKGDEDYLAKVEPALQTRLIACYQNVLVDPPINADAVVEWLKKHPNTPMEVELAALETLSIVGTTIPDAVKQLAERLLAKSETALTIARRYLAGHLGDSLLTQIRESLKQHAATDQTGQTQNLFLQLDQPRP